MEMECKKIGKKHFNFLNEVQNNPMYMHKTFLVLVIKMDLECKKMRKKQFNFGNNVQTKVMLRHNTILLFVIKKEMECKKILQKKAIQLYEQSANQGNANAQYNLGVCYKNGDGVTKDLEKAAKSNSTF
eukprot:TRINITY_DN3683_c0_g1_i23.p1 TRINITY_DN3683_c0_g1~~TRINITY_DN3683_c0_g1_i23.p1  ORF type:complete len:129 (+),score=34.69 TRINITY_DN3683_c0_g1_i23:106-492(+)